MLNTAAATAATAATVEKVSVLKCCKVDGCVQTATVGGTLCNSCFALLPEGARFAVEWILRRMTRTGRPDWMVREDEDVLGACLERLACEHMSEPTVEELLEADSLTRKCHNFATFAELINASNGYWPKLPCSLSDRVSPEHRRASIRLANLYDRAQKARGDARRATRMGCAGI